MIVAASPFVFFHFSAIFWTIILQSRLDDVNVRYPMDAVLSHPRLLADLIGRVWLGPEKISMKTFWLFDH